MNFPAQTSPKADIPSAASSDQAQPRSAGVRIEGLRVQFDDRSPVLDGLDLSIQPGEIISLVGASGCGKSTLLRTIAGLQSYQAGSITYPRNRPSPLGSADQSATRLNSSTSQSELIHESPTNEGPVDKAFVFQDATLLPWRTVFENVRLPFELRGHRHLASSQQALDNRVEVALRAVDLSEQHWRMFPRQLSGGMRMRTSIARALVTDPSLLLLDEPFAALDDILRTKLNQLMIDLWEKKQRTILFVTHNIAEAVMLSHRVAIVAGGRIAAIMTNDLSWPRRTEQRTSLTFAEKYSEVSRLLVQHSNGTDKK
ncbi:MAG: ATP-binding cassette domain-containing protein [Pirellulales bacterium]